MTTHVLKCQPAYFAAVLCGAKTFELRNEYDRQFAVGDVLVLQEWDTSGWTGPTGRALHRAVSFVLRDFTGLAPQHVVLGLATSLAPRAPVDSAYRNSREVRQALLGLPNTELGNDELRRRLSGLCERWEREHPPSAEGLSVEEALDLLRWCYRRVDDRSKGSTRCVRADPAGHTYEFAESLSSVRVRELLGIRTEPGL